VKQLGGIFKKKDMEKLFRKYLQVDKEFDGNFCLTKFEQINNYTIDDLLELKAFW
jgi:hypothetical protein